MGITATLTGSGYVVSPIDPTSFTWATLPAPASYIGVAYVSDIGAGGSFWESDGVRWGIVGGSVVLSQSAVALAAITGTTVEQSQVTYSLAVSPGAGPILGTDGWLDIEFGATVTNGVNTKTFRTRLGGAGVGGTQMSQFQSVSHPAVTGTSRISARGSLSSQIGSTNTDGFGGATVGFYTAAVNTTTATLVALTSQLGVSGDSIVMERHRIVLHRP